MNGLVIYHAYFVYELCFFWTRSIISALVLSQFKCTYNKEKYKTIKN